MHDIFQNQDATVQELDEIIDLHEKAMALLKQHKLDEKDKKCKVIKKICNFCQFVHKFQFLSFSLRNTTINKIGWTVFGVFYTSRTENVVQCKEVIFMNEVWLFYKYTRQ